MNNSNIEEYNNFYGKIDYLSMKGEVMETIYYENKEKFGKEIKDNNYIGRPIYSYTYEKYKEDIKKLSKNFKHTQLFTAEEAEVMLGAVEFMQEKLCKGNANVKKFITGDYINNEYKMVQSVLFRLKINIEENNNMIEIMKQNANIMKKIDKEINSPLNKVRTIFNPHYRKNFIGLKERLKELSDTFTSKGLIGITTDEQLKHFDDFVAKINNKNMRIYKSYTVEEKILRPAIRTIERVEKEYNKPIKVVHKNLNHDISLSL